MAGNNSHYHLSMPTGLKKKLQEKADKEGIFLSELIRKIFHNQIKKQNFKDTLNRIEKKLDKILQKL